MPTRLLVIEWPARHDVRWIFRLVARNMELVSLKRKRPLMASALVPGLASAPVLHLANNIAAMPSLPGLRPSSPC